MYACFAFFPDGSVKRWKYVTNLESFAAFLSKSHPTWKYFNVYDKGTKGYLKRFYTGNAVPKALSFALLFFFSIMFSISQSGKRPSRTYENTFTKTTFTNGFNNTATISTPTNKRGGSI